MIVEGTNVNDQTPEMLKKLQAAALNHPLLAQSGALNAQALSNDPVFKAIAKYLPYIILGFVVLRFIGVQQNVLLLRRIEKRLNTLDKSCPVKK